MLDISMLRKSNVFLKLYLEKHHSSAYSSLPFLHLIPWSPTTLLFLVYASCFPVMLFCNDKQVYAHFLIFYYFLYNISIACMFFYTLFIYLTVYLVNRILSHWILQQQRPLLNSPMLGDLGSLLYFAIINNTAMNNHIHLHVTNTFSYIWRHIFRANSQK